MGKNDDLFSVYQAAVQNRGITLVTYNYYEVVFLISKRELRFWKEGSFVFSNRSGFSDLHHSDLDQLELLATNLMDRWFPSLQRFNEIQKERKLEDLNLQQEHFPFMEEG